MKQKMTEAEEIRRDCARWLRDHVSDIDWGHADQSTPKNICRNSEWRLQGAMKLRKTNYERKRDGLPAVKEVYVDVNQSAKPFKGWCQLPLWRIQAHLQRLETIYYGSRPSLKTDLIMLDFDWHQEAIEQYGDDTDAIKAAEFIRALYFEEHTVYIEPSTGGLGAHAYLLIDRGEFSPQHLDRILEQLKPVIQSLLRLEGFKCHFCGFYGTCTVFEKGWQIPDGGMSRLGKLPRPNKSEQMKTLMALRPVGICAMALRADPLFLSIFLEDMGLPESYAAALTAPTAASPTATAPSTTFQYQQGIQFGHIKRSGEDEAVRLAAIRAMTNPNQRVFQAVYLLARQLDRPPSAEEAISYYVGSGLHSGEDVKNRRWNRIEEAVEECRKTFVAAKRMGVQRYQALVNSLVSDEDLAKSGYFRRLWREDVAVALYVATKALTHPPRNPLYYGTLGVGYLTSAFANLREAGLSERGLNGAKWKAIKKVLERAGLLVRIAKKRPGVSEKFVLGLKHPLRGQESSRPKEGVQTASVESIK